MESKYTKRIVSAFPSDFNVNLSTRDPLRSLCNELSVLIEKSRLTMDELINGLSIVSINPLLTSHVFYVPLDNQYYIDNFSISAETNSNSIVTDDEDEFFSDAITGFDLEEIIYPSGLTPYKIYPVGSVFPSGDIPYPENYDSEIEFLNDFPDKILTRNVSVSQIIGLSNGFDWEDPEICISVLYDPHIYRYTNNFSSLEIEDFCVKTKNYENTNSDEWLNIIQEQIKYDDILPRSLYSSGITESNLVNVAYTEFPPYSNIKIIDTNNLSNPNDPNSDGIIVSPADYTVNGNKIIFANERSDYNPYINKLNNSNVWYSADNYNVNNGIITDLKDNVNKTSFESINKSSLGFKLRKYNNNDINFIYGENVNSFSTNTDFKNIYLNNNEFDIILNHKLLYSGDNYFFKILFDNENLYIKYLFKDGINKIILFFQDHQKYISIDLDYNYTSLFHILRIQYRGGKFTVLLNDKKLYQEVIDFTFNYIYSLEYKIFDTWQTGLTDIFVYGYSVNSEDEKNIINYLLEKNLILNAESIVDNCFVRFNFKRFNIEKIDTLNSLDSNVTLSLNDNSDENYKPEILLENNIKYLNLKYDGVKYFKLEGILPYNLSNKNSTIFIVSQSNSLDVNVELSNGTYSLIYKPDNISLIGDNLVEVNNTFGSIINTSSIFLSNFLNFQFNKNIIYIDNNLENIHDDMNILSIYGDNIKIYDIIIFDKHLNDVEMNIVNDYLSYTYGTLNSSFGYINSSTKLFDNISQFTKPYYSLIYDNTSFYQPDKEFNSTYIIEYNYKYKENPRYLTHIYKREKLNLKGDIISNSKLIN